MEKVRKILLILIIVLALIVIYYNTFLFINYAISLKYEVEHAEIIVDSNKDISNRRKEIENIMDFCRLIYIFSIVTIVGAILSFKRNNTK